MKKEICATCGHTQNSHTIMRCYGEFCCCMKFVKQRENRKPQIDPKFL